MNHMWNGVKRKKILQLTTLIGQNVCFQSVFEGYNTFTYFDVYRNSIEYSGTTVRNVLHGLSRVCGTRRTSLGFV